MDPELDAWLRTIRAMGLLAGVDVSASAVVRLAVRALREQNTPQQLIDHFTHAGKDTPRKGPGRPRR